MSPRGDQSFAVNGVSISFADPRVGRMLTYGLMTNHSCWEMVLSADAYVKNCMECIEMFETILCFVMRRQNPHIMGNFRCHEFEATQRVVQSLILSVISPPLQQNFMVVIVSIMLFITRQGAKTHERNNKKVCI